MLAGLKTAWGRVGRILLDMRSEEALRIRAINIGHLLTGNFGAILFTLGSVAFAARALGPTEYGLLALITVFVQAIERLVAFQTWQPIIRFGAGLDGPEHKSDFRALIKFGFLLDLSTAFSGWVIAMTLIAVSGSLMGWDGEALKPGFIYATILLFAINGTPVGILRLAGKFRSVAYAQTASMAVRLPLCAYAYFAGWGLTHFIVIWTITHILGAVLLMIVASLDLKKKNSLDFITEKIGSISERFPKIWRFSISTNLSSAVRSSAQQLDTLLVGALTDPAQAGYYHIAKRIAKFAQQAGNQVQAVVFPEIAKIWADRNFAKFKHVIFQTESILVVLGIIGVVITYFVAGPMVKLFAGESFLPAAQLLVVQMMAVVLVLNGSVVRSALLTMGYEIPVLKIATASTVTFFIAAIILLPILGAVGANIAHIILGVVWLVGLLLLFRRVFAKELKTTSVSDANGWRS